MSRGKTVPLRRIKPGAPMADEPTGYHHGSLRESLLDAAESLLLERGLEGFSLRECARRAGVSHGAPAHHFGDARGLLTAFATVGFERLGERMRRQADAVGPDQVARLLAVGQAYLGFALDHPAHYRLMFRRDLVDSSDPDLQRSGAAAAQALAWALSAALAERGVGDDDLPDRCLLAWSSVHGLAMLALDADLRPFGIEGPQADDALPVVTRLLQRLQAALLGAA